MNEIKINISINTIFLSKYKFPIKENVVKKLINKFKNNFFLSCIIIFISYLLIIKQHKNIKIKSNTL